MGPVQCQGFDAREESQTRLALLSVQCQNPV